MFVGSSAFLSRFIITLIIILPVFSVSAMKVTIKDRVLYSPCPTIDIPCCSIFSVLKTGVESAAKKVVLASILYTPNNASLLFLLRVIKTSDHFYFQKQNICGNSKVINKHSASKKLLFSEYVSYVTKINTPPPSKKKQEKKTTSVILTSRLSNEIHE